MKGKILLSVVVPTKDRYFYLQKLMVLLNSFESKDIEMVIEDNTEDNAEFLAHFEQNDFPFLSIVYNHTAKQIPISLNSDNAINHSSGEYVSFIGDDDGVTKAVLECVNWMKSNGVEAVLPSTVFYSWPDAKEHQKKGLDLSSKIRHPRFTGDIVRKSSEDVLKELIDRGCTDRGGLPLLYHGIVKRSTLDKIYSTCGTYFPGPSPDIANGVALALVTDHFYAIDMPIAIAGASKHHGGGIKKMKNRAADIDTLPFLPPEAKENWEKRIPLIWTGETVWCESAVKAMRKMGRNDLADQVNYEQLYAQFSAFHYPLRGMAYKLSSNKLMLFVRSNWYVVKRYFNALIRMIRLRIGWNDNVIVKAGLNDIIEAVRYLESYHFNFNNITSPNEK